MILIERLFDVVLVEMPVSLIVSVYLILCVYSCIMFNSQTKKYYFGIYNLSDSILL